MAEDLDNEEMSDEEKRMAAEWAAMAEEDDEDSTGGMTDDDAMAAEWEAMGDEASLEYGQPVRHPGHRQQRACLLRTPADAGGGVRPPCARSVHHPA